MGLTIILKPYFWLDVIQLLFLGVYPPRYIDLIYNQLFHWKVSFPNSDRIRSLMAEVIQGHTIFVLRSLLKFVFLHMSRLIMIDAETIQVSSGCIDLYVDNLGSDVLMIFPAVHVFFNCSPAAIVNSFA